MRSNPLRQPSPQYLPEFLREDRRCCARSGGHLDCCSIEVAIALCSATWKHRNRPSEPMLQAWNKLLSFLEREALRWWTASPSWVCHIGFDQTCCIPQNCRENLGLILGNLGMPRTNPPCCWFYPINSCELCPIIYQLAQYFPILVG